MAGCWNGRAAINFGDKSLGEQLIDLKKAMDEGAISEEEFVKTKADMLALVSCNKAFDFD